ncbi:hypothetical protein V6615_15950 [Oscillospiraceae bacterium PP1C4]
MTITVHAPLKGEQIRTLLDGYKKDGVTFSFVKRTGITLTFEVTGASADDACALAKSLIKGTEFGKVLYLSITCG